MRLKEKSKSRIKRVLVAALVCVFSVCMVNFVSALSYDNSDLFECGDGVTMTRNHKNVFDKRYGVLFSQKTEGDVFCIKNVMTGNFEMDFRVFKDATFSAFDGKKDERLYGVKELVFTVTDEENGNSFDIVLQSSSISSVTPQCFVRYNGEKVGVHYRYAGVYNEALENTTNYNENGYYTTLWGTSFCNYSQEGEYFSTSYKSTIIGFNPEDMTVYAYSKDEKVCVWNFSTSINDGRKVDFTLGGFEKYTVKARIAQLRENVTARMSVYSINGQSLCSENHNAPRIIAQSKLNGVVGKNYFLPLPEVYDLFDGKIENVGVSVKDGGGNSVKLFAVNGEITDGKYVVGAYFIPAATGRYIITYTAENSDRIASALSVETEIYDELPESVFSSINFEKSYGTGYKLQIPSRIATNGIYRDGREIPVNAYLIAPDSDVPTLIENGFVNLDKNGEYEIRYETADETVKDCESVFFSVSDETGIFRYELLNTVRYRGETFVMPDCEFFIKGRAYPVSVKIIKPNGSAFFAKELVLKDSGKYVLQFASTVNGKTYFEKAYFEVFDEPAEQFENVNNSTIKGDAESNLSAGINGIKITTKGEGTIKYKNEISFGGKTRDDTLVEVIVTPEIAGIEEFRVLKFSFADTGNPKNVLTVSLSTSVDDNTLYSWVKAGTSGNKLQGLYNGTLFDDTYLGCLVGHSFAGIGRSTTLSKQTVKISIDYLTKCVYANGSLVVDLDSPEHVTSPWQGFTADKAELTISTANVLQPYASYTILTLDGVKTGNAVTDKTVTPKISVDMQGYNVAPYGKAGVEYPIFNASAYHPYYGKVEVDRRVFKNYGTFSSGEIEVKNGKFTPDSEGVYTIVYSAYNPFGYAEVKLVSVKVLGKNKFENPSVELVGFKPVGKVGEEYILPEYKINGSGGSISVSATIVSPDGDNISVDDRFIPTSAGTYKFIVVSEDYLGIKTVAEKEIIVEENSKPIIESVSFGKYYVAGRPISIPEVSASDYSENGKKRIAEVKTFVSFNGVETRVTDGVFTPILSDNEKSKPAAIIYRSYNYSGSDFSEVQYDITVINVKKSGGEEAEIDLSKYFVLSDFGSGSQGNSDYVSFKGEKDFSVGFINGLPAEDFSLEFAISKGNFDKINLVLYDAYNESDSVTLEFVREKNGDNAIIGIKGTDINTVVSGSFDNPSKHFRVSYSDLNRVLYAAKKDTGTNLQISLFEKYDDGREFAGFTSGKIMFKAELSGVHGEAEINIISICNQQFVADNYEDLVKPLVFVKGNVNYNGKIGDKVIIPTAYAIDVLDGEVKVTVKVVGPEGVIINEELADISREITLGQTGTYYMIYTATDFAGNGFQQRKGVNVADTTKPVIKFTTPPPSKITVGKSVSLKNYIVSDEFYSSDLLKVAVFVIDENYSMRQVTSDSYAFTAKGKYKIRYFVYDPDMNYCISEFEVEVE